MIAAPSSTSLAGWHRQFGRASRRTAEPRPWAALSYLTTGPVIDDLIEVENVTFVVLYDEVQTHGQLWVTLAGFGGARVPWGIQWGGPEHSRFRKNLLLVPRRFGRGRCLDVFDTGLLKLALRLDEKVHRRGSRPQPSQGLRLPRLWAGFRRRHLDAIDTDDPALQATAEHSARSPHELLQESRRDYEGLALFPLEWTRQHGAQMTAVFADLQGFPRIQVIPVERLADHLRGQQAAAKFDFYGTRFRPVPEEMSTSISVVPAAV
jgi:hypothetical protein